MVTRSSFEQLELCNTIFIDPNFCGTFVKTKVFIEEVRVNYPHIVVVIFSSQDVINDFIHSAGDRFKHYFQFECSNNDSIEGQKFEELTKMCKIEIERYYARKYEYDVALSFAGEDREYVEKVAHALVNLGLKVFYDKYEEVDLWGKNLYTHLDDVYQHKARYCIIFISKYYKHKLWTNHERESAQARAFTEKKEYILPVKIDDTEIPGIKPTVAYLRSENMTPEKLAIKTAEKISN